MSISLPISSGTIGNISQLTVDARSLHEVLEVKRDFSTWIKGRISKATGKESRLDFMLAASLVGPKHATLEMLKSAQRIAENACKTHFLVCEAGK